MDPTRVNGLEHASIVTPEQERRGRRSASPAFDRPLWSSEEFETPTHETAPFRVVLSDDGLPLDRLVRFGGMFFARLRGTHGVHGAHKFPGEWVIVEEGALSGVSRAHFETARMKEGLHHPIVSLGFGSQDVSAVASGAGPAAGLGDSLPGDARGSAPDSGAAAPEGHCLDGAVRALLAARGLPAPPPFASSRMEFRHLKVWLLQNAKPGKIRVEAATLGSRNQPPTLTELANPEAPLLIIGVELANGADHAFTVDRDAGLAYDVAEEPPARPLRAYLDELKANEASVTHARVLLVGERRQKRRRPSKRGSAKRAARREQSRSRC